MWRSDFSFGKILGGVLWRSAATRTKSKLELPACLEQLLIIIINNKRWTIRIPMRTRERENCTQNGCFFFELNWIYRIQPKQLKQSESGNDRKLIDVCIVSDDSFFVKSCHSVHRSDEASVVVFCKTFRSVCSNIDHHDFSGSNWFSSDHFKKLIKSF